MSILQRLLILILAGLGGVDACLLGLGKFQTKPGVHCAACESVSILPESHFLGLHIAWLGMVAYSCIFIGVLVHSTKRLPIPNWLIVLLIGYCVCSLLLGTDLVFVRHLQCPGCLANAIISTLLALCFCQAQARRLTR